MSIQEKFEKFYKNIKLTKTQREDAKIKYKGVCKKLHDYYYTDIEYNGNSKLLIGSYGKHTNIRPPRDVDVLFIMPPEKFEQYDDNSSNSQSQLLQDIKKILSDKYSTTDKIKAWGKVVLVQFSDGYHNIELLPAWQKDNGKFLIPNSANNGSWDEWDLKSEIVKIKKSNNDNNKKTIPLIRMIKKWSDTCAVELKSYKIEYNVLNFINLNDSSQEYSVLIKNLFNYLYHNITKESIKSHIKTAYNRAVKACDFEKNSKFEKAIEEWKKIFGDDFPKGKISKEITVVYQQKLSELQRLYPSYKEEYIDSHYNIPIQIDNDCFVKIDALIKQNGFRDKMLSEYLKNRLPLVKEMSIILKIIRINIPEPFNVKWKVRNFGDEAQRVDDLRGEISDDVGGLEKKENTKYRGEHYVECYIIKNNYCVATDRIFVPIQ